MTKITLFTLDDSSSCDKTKQLLASHRAVVNEVSLTAHPEWAGLLFLLANGDKNLPQVFFNSHHVGGSGEVESMEKEGVLGNKVKECLEGGSEEFPPPLRMPKAVEYVELIPAEVRTKWQQYLEAMDTALRATVSRPISSLLITIETHDSIVLVCTTGPAKETFTVGTAVCKGSEDSQNQTYCQVALKRKGSLFVTDPMMVPGLEQNELMVAYGYSYYAGTPWTVGHCKGTVVAMETEPGILKPEHMAIIEATRDKVAAELTQYRATH